MNDVLLEIDSKSVEELYEWYDKGGLIVNRRYQRKLVWSLDEKQALISSIMSDYPIPLLLFVTLENKREILDGMQRLEAIMSFIEQRYSFDGKYFDLEATATTKSFKDSGKINQKEPMLPRENSAKFARYKFAISEYSSTEDNIDEVFRRINSNGKTLSKQELRSAGSLSNFSDMVRLISMKIRGDVSHDDIINLRNMTKISIGGDSLQYGVSIENHFYVSHGVLTRRNIRESSDEELIANILGYLSLNTKPTSGSDSLNGFYRLIETTHAKQQVEEIDGYIQTVGRELIIQNFLFIYEEIKTLFDEGTVKFNSHILGDGNSSHDCPRYYQVIFLSFYELIINDNMEVSNKTELLEKLKNIGASGLIKKTEGGRWAASKREQSVDDVKAHIMRYFKVNKNKRENVAWVTEIDNILVSSNSEQSNYDFKIGFSNLDEKHEFNNDCLSQVLQTCVGISNIGKKSNGFILIGIADNETDAKRVENLYGITSVEKAGHYIVGVDHEAKALCGGIDKYLQMLKQKIENSDNINEKLKQQVLKDIKVYKYSEDKHLIKLDIKTIGEVASLNGKFYLRQGTSTKCLSEADEISALFTNYLSGR